MHLIMELGSCSASFNLQGSLLFCGSLTQSPIISFPLITTTDTCPHKKKKKTFTYIKSRGVQTAKLNHCQNTDMKICFTANIKEIFSVKKNQAAGVFKSKPSILPLMLCFLNYA